MVTNALVEAAISRLGALQAVTVTQGKLTAGGRPSKRGRAPADRPADRGPLMRTGAQAG